MHTCECGEPIKNPRAKVCMICRNRANNDRRRVDLTMDYIRSMSDEDEDGCWIWLGSTIKASPERGGAEYGQIGVSAAKVLKERLAHRISYVLANRKSIQGEIDHLCRNTLCVNPAHLQDVPHRLNMARAPHLSRRDETGRWTKIPGSDPPVDSEDPMVSGDSQRPALG